MQDHYFNVLHQFRAGQLDPVNTNERDLRIIRAYLRTEAEVTKRLGSAGKAPSIARAVLGKVWQEPRVGFHGRNLAGRNKSDFGTKLLLVPWSEEAFKEFKRQGSVKGLRFEHVTPVDALWKQLHKIHNESKTEEEWIDVAGQYLQTHFVVAVLTKKQAFAIDRVGLKQTGFYGMPFQRYAEAAQKLKDEAAKTVEPPVVLNLDRFVHPGVLPG